jgi:hypothetical protein
VRQQQARGGTHRDRQHREREVRAVRPLGERGLDDARQTLAADRCGQVDAEPAVSSVLRVGIGIPRRQLDTAVDEARADRVGGLVGGRQHPLRVTRAFAQHAHDDRRIDIRERG